MIRPNTIFVSVASYRDNLCTKTLESIFSNASNPLNVFIGLVQQNELSDSNCNDYNSEILKAYKNNIRTIKLLPYQAKGPTYARYLASTLWDGEEYFLQADSHILMAKDWDTKAINMIKEIKETTNSKKPLLSHYVKNYEEYNQPNPNNEVPRICQAFFNERGMISFYGAENISIDTHTYVQTPFIAGGFLFAEYTFLQEVPFDDNLPYLFVGEEILHSARAYTSGWDIYTPSENLMFHFYTRPDDKKIWTDQVYQDDDAFNKVKKILNINTEQNLPEYINKNIDKYSLGTERTLQQYYDFAGINVATKTVNKNFCKDEITPNNIITPLQYDFFHILKLLPTVICALFFLALIVIILYYKFYYKNKITNFY